MFLFMRDPLKTKRLINIINKMYLLQLFMLLTEILDNILPWQYVERTATRMQADFETPNSKLSYCVIADRWNDLPNTWIVEFDSESVNGLMGFKTTNTGDQFYVFATVVDIFQNFISTYHPTEIVMCGDTPVRIKIYSRLCKRVLPNWTIQYPNEATITVLHPSLNGRSSIPWDNEDE